MSRRCAGGEVDVVQVFEPFAATLLAELSAMCGTRRRAAARHRTRRSMRAAACCATRRDELHRMVRAIYRTQKWVADADGAAIAAAIARYFPDVPPAILAAACARYKSLGIWGTRSTSAARRLRSAVGKPGVWRLRLAGHAVRGGGGQQPR